MMRLIILFMIALIMAGAGAQQAFAASAASVTSDGVNCRAAPARSARVVATLDATDDFETVRRRGGWLQARLSDGTECWISSSLVAAAARPLTFTAGRSLATPRPRATRGYATPRRLASPAIPRRSGRKSSRSSGFSSGGCPCGTGAVCVGPRGGRYCITSGGNKRYGM